MYFLLIFRDVRPSNIYVQQDDALVLGDFGVATIRGDAVTCTRASAGKRLLSFTLGDRIPYLPQLFTILVLKFEHVQFTTRCCV